jgi:hypothetical protein
LGCFAADCGAALTVLLWSRQKWIPTFASAGVTFSPSPYRTSPVFLFSWITNCAGPCPHGGPPFLCASNIWAHGYLLTGRHRLGALHCFPRLGSGRGASECIAFDPLANLGNGRSRQTVQSRYLASFGRDYQVFTLGQSSPPYDPDYPILMPEQKWMLLSNPAAELVSINRDDKGLAFLFFQETSNIGNCIGWTCTGGST